jgi:hypothetical protein
LLPFTNPDTCFEPVLVKGLAASDVPLNNGLDIPEDIGTGLLLENPGGADKPGGAFKPGGAVRPGGGDRPGGGVGEDFIRSPRVNAEALIAGSEADKLLLKTSSKNGCSAAFLLLNPGGFEFCLKPGGGLTVFFDFFFLDDWAFLLLGAGARGNSGKSATKSSKKKKSKNTVKPPPGFKQNSKPPGFSNKKAAEQPFLLEVLSKSLSASEPAINASALTLGDLIKSSPTPPPGLSPPPGLTAPPGLKAPPGLSAPPGFSSKSPVPMSSGMSSPLFNGTSDAAKPLTNTGSKQVSGLVNGSKIVSTKMNGFLNDDSDFPGLPSAPSKKFSYTENKVSSTKTNGFLNDDSDFPGLSSAPAKKFSTNRKVLSTRTNGFLNDDSDFPGLPSAPAI